MPMNLGLGLGLGSRGDTLWWLSGSELDLDFSGSRAFNRSTGFNGSPNGILTYTSPSPKLVYGDDGVLRYAPHNLFSHSGDLSNAAWGKIRGSATADKFSCDSTADASHSFQQNVITAGVAVVLTVELKPAEITTVFIQLGGTIIRAVNLSTGAMGSYSFGTSTAALVAAEDGYYLLTLSGVPSNTNLLFFAGEGDGSTLDITLAGVRTGEGFYARKLQVSYGTVAFDYIPTTSAAVYSLPIDHDPITFEPLGVLIEEQRTNLLTYSEQFDNAAWLIGGLNSAVNANAAVAPDGTTTADRLIDNSAGGSGTVGIAVSATVSVATTYTFSAYIKADQLSMAQLNTTSFTTPGNVGVWFDLAAGTVLTQEAGLIGRIQSVGNGWYRCSITFTTDAVDTSGQLRIYPTETDGVTVVTRDGTSSIFIWGAQFEAGAFATSYIPTVASQVTRAADQVSILTSAFGYSATEGTMVAAARAILANSLGAAASVNDGTGNEEIVIYRDASGNLVYQVEDGGANQLDPLDSGQNAANLTEYKMAAAWGANDFAAAVNGNAAVTDTSGTLPTVTTLEVGVNQANNYFNGTIKRLTYFPTRKTDSELQALSA